MGGDPQFDDSPKTLLRPLRPGPGSDSDTATGTVLAPPYGSAGNQALQHTNFGSPISGSGSTQSLSNSPGGPGPTANTRIRIADTKETADAHGKASSSTEVVLDYDPGDSTTLVLSSHNVPPTQEIKLVEADVLPVTIQYSRTLRVTDVEGRDCTAVIHGSVNFSRENFLRQMKGRDLTLATLAELQGETGSMSVSVRGQGGMAGTYFSNFVARDSSSVSLSLLSGEVRLSGDSNQPVQHPPFQIAHPDVSIVDQYKALDSYLHRADYNYAVEGLVTSKEGSAVGGKTQTGTGKVEGANEKSDDDSESIFAKLWNALPAKVRGILEAVASFILAATITIAAIAAAAVLIAVVVAAFTEVAFAAAFMVAFKALTVTLLVGVFGLSLYNRSKEAAASGNVNPLTILGVALLDTIGVSRVIEAVTDRDMISGKELNRSEEERWKAGTEGVFQTVLTFFGLRSMRRGGPSTGIDEPGVPDAPAPDQPTAIPAVGEVDASQFNTPEDYLDALRAAPPRPSLAGPAWDHARFPIGPRRVWQPGDPIDMPGRDGTYPTFDTARPRFWRNRAAIELELRAQGTRSRVPDSSDPISAMSDADLQTLRDTPSADVSSPRDPNTGRAMEIEHFGVPQRVGGWLQSAGFFASEARRLSNAANPGALLDVPPTEHAFFDAAAERFGSQRADPWGNRWSLTGQSDPRVGRPMYFMSDAAITEIVTRGRIDPTINLSNSPALVSGLRAEIAARNLPLVPP